jgi:hypothetical protein
VRSARLRLQLRRARFVFSYGVAGPRVAEGEAWGQRRDSNPQPLVYETLALPLCYAGSSPRSSQSERRRTTLRTCRRNDGLQIDQVQTARSEAAFVCPARRSSLFSRGRHWLAGNKQFKFSHSSSRSAPFARAARGPIDEIEVTFSSLGLRQSGRDSATDERKRVRRGEKPRSYTVFGSTSGRLLGHLSPPACCGGGLACADVTLLVSALFRAAPDSSDRASLRICARIRPTS